MVCLSSGCFASFCRPLSFYDSRSFAELWLFNNETLSHKRSESHNKRTTSEQQALRQSREVRHRLISLFQALPPQCQDVCGGKGGSIWRPRSLTKQRHLLTFKKKRSWQRQHFKHRRRRDGGARTPGAVAVDQYFFGVGALLSREQRRCDYSRHHPPLAVFHCCG